jgi:hypothetical protein
MSPYSITDRTFLYDDNHLIQGKHILQGAFILLDYSDGILGLLLKGDSYEN